LLVMWVISGFLTLIASARQEATVAPSPLADAAEAGDVDQIRKLLTTGADVNAPQADGMTALHWAVRQVFFPMSGEKDGWSRLAKNLKAEIDEDLIEAYRGTVSLPFELGKNRRIAAKIIDDRGIECLKIIVVER
jgi:Ankyrin repeats (many copies)